MLRHVILIRFHDGTTDEKVEAAATALRALPARIPQMRGYHVDRDAGLQSPPAQFEFGIVGEFDDEAGWKAYMDDPEHDRIRKELLGPLVAERATVQFRS